MFTLGTNCHCSIAESTLQTKSACYHLHRTRDSPQMCIVGSSRHKKKTTFIGGMEQVSLRCNRDFTSASSYGLGWCKYAIATQWYQFHTTDAWWFSLRISWCISCSYTQRYTHIKTCQAYESISRHKISWIVKKILLYIVWQWIGSQADKKSFYPIPVT